jgi:hypothetical protein
MLLAFLVLSLHFSAAEESQINVDCCGYIAGCLQQTGRLIGRALSDPMNKRASDYGGKEKSLAQETGRDS